MGRKMNMKNEKKIKVLVADNSEFARNNLKKFLENNEKIQLLNIADNGKDAYRVIIDEVQQIVLIQSCITPNVISSPIFRFKQRTCNHIVEAIFHILFQRDVYSIISALTGVGQDSVQIKFLMVNDREGGVLFNRYTK